MDSETQMKDLFSEPIGQADEMRIQSMFARHGTPMSQIGVAGIVRQNCQVWGTAAIGADRQTLQDIPHEHQFEGSPPQQLKNPHRLKYRHHVCALHMEDRHGRWQSQYRGRPSQHENSLPETRGRQPVEQESKLRKSVFRGRFVYNMEQAGSHDLIMIEVWPAFKLRTACRFASVAGDGTLWLVLVTPHQPAV